MPESRAPRPYCILLRALPRDFRDRFGTDMEALFVERVREAGTSQRARVAVWLHAIADVLGHAAAERVARLVTRRATKDATVADYERPLHSTRSRAMESIVNDVRFALRGLVRSTGFAAVAVITLALGVGVNTAVFSVVNALLLRPLPYSEPERLVSVWPEIAFNMTLLGRVGDEVPGLESITGVSLFNLTASGDGEPEEVAALFVSPNHFDVLGVTPLMGRSFASSEGERGSGDVVILSHAFWRSRYGGDPSIIGRRIRLTGPLHETHQVIGVMGPQHRPVLGKPAAWVPLERVRGQTLATDHTWWVTLRIGRLAAGVTREQAEAQLRATTPAVRAEVAFITEDDARGASLAPLHHTAVGPLRGALWILLGAVGLVLLIACMNVANLLLARGEARAQELALRRALGAGSGRLIRQLLTESLVLALAGGAAGLIIAQLMLRAILAQAPPDLPEIAGVRLDGAVLAFALLASCAAALVFGAAPALRVRRVATAYVARQGTKGSVGPAGRRTVLSGMLVTAEVALAVVLVVGSGLMLRTLGKLYDVDPGFRAEGVLVLRSNPSPTRHPQGAGYHRFYANVLERIRALPGVESAGGIQIRPVTTDEWKYPLFPEGHAVAPGASPPSHDFRLVTPGYFETLRIPLLAGRAIEHADRADAPAVVVVNRAFAERYWPGGDAIGKQLRLFHAAGDGYHVVGVVGDVRQRALDTPPEPEIYIPHAQVPWQVALWVMVRARDGDPARLAPAVREAVWSVDSETPIAQMEPLEQVVGRSAALTRFFALLLALFGMLALVLGAVGVYGVTSYTVARRLPEFGVRLALGATARDVLGSALAQGSAPVALGIGIGTLVALALTGLLRALLFQVSPRDPATFAAVAGLLALVGLAALLLPALRATRADPLAALRRE